MKKFILATVAMLGMLQYAFASIQIPYHVSEDDINYGYVAEKIWLDHYSMPAVVISDINYTGVTTLPEKTITADAAQFRLSLGKERKRAFVMVYIPAYRKTANNEFQQLADFTLTITENNTPASGIKIAPLAKTTGSHSLLASGTWYKIALSQRGIYKIDYDFLKNKLGITAATINSSSIRLFGSGGTIISKNNAVPKYDDLPENAIWINDGGDGVFNQGDYFLFYANGTMGWTKDSVNKRFLHDKNIYEDESYYFLNFDVSGGARISQQGNAPAGNTTVTDYNDYTVHEDDINILAKEWLGEMFSTQPGKQNSYSFNFPLGTLTDSIRMRMQLVTASSAAGNIFSVTANSQPLVTYYPGATSDDVIGVPNYGEFKLAANSSVNIGIQFQPASTDGKGYLDYIEFNTRRALSFTGGQFTFRDWKSVGNNNVARYDIGNANGNFQVWDITNPLIPVKMNGTLNGSTYSITQDAASLHEFAAFDGSQFLSAEYIGTVGNQDLHAAPLSDFIIVTYPSFLDAANKLADFHRQHDNMTAYVATTTQVYNEFGSGSQDISAIRDFAKMFYDRAGNDTTMMPKYLLLMGDASYDYKNRVPANTNFVPTHETNGFLSISAYCNDDFYGFLDNNEDINNDTLINTLDVGIGRIPVQTAAEAMDVVNKIIRYKAPSSLGPWRISNTYIGDNEDFAGYHLTDAESMAAVVDGMDKIYNDTKIYLDNLPFVSTPGGERCPDANKAINDQIFLGTFMINYSGHGNTFTLAHERILTADDFNSWKNADKLPFMVTATCDFSQFDEPTSESAGEKLVLKKDGGAIAMLTTTQAVYATENAALNSAFIGSLFHENNGVWPTFGEAYRVGKNKTYSHQQSGTVTNFRKFVLLGDPALLPDFPKYFVHTEAIKNMDDNQPADSVKALGGYVVSGSVTDVNGQVLNNFNGNVYIRFYDKPRTVSVITKEFKMTRKYNVQDNVIYKGKATVTNGKFNFAFIAPKDLNYDFGKGKISYYAENGADDAAGIDSSVIVGGASDHPYVDNDAPIVKPYMNDSLFIDGGVTGINSILFVSLYDETGINVSGNNVGHDLTAVLDNDIEHPYILNDYYETAPNEYQHGFATFPITGLADGLHSFTVKAWDVNNNSGEGLVHFVVYNGSVMVVDKLMNYPNPFNNITHFVFEHNHPDENLTATIRIYNTQGMLVRTLEQKFAAEGSRSREVMWDGTDNDGARIPSGVYVYRLKLAAENGAQATAYEKLVFIR